MNKVAVVGVATALWLGCGGGQSGGTAPQLEPGPDFCAVDEAIAATARPKPAEIGCIDKERYAQKTSDCNDGDTDACYQVGVCVKLQILGREDEVPAEQAELHFKAILDTMRRACDAGVAKACLFRAAAIHDELDVHPERADKAALEIEKCRDSLRACKLGDTADGCASCVQFDCESVLK